MPLIKYSQYLTYPDGSPAAEADFPVQLLGGNVLVPTFTSKAGTTPLANPVMTDVDGLLSFYAAPGAFYTDIAGTVFLYPVDGAETDDAWPGTFIHVQSSSSSTWTVNHHFGVEPHVEVVLSGTVANATVSHPSAEQTVITFGASTTGTAYLRR
jgi:hypothetical protein